MGCCGKGGGRRQTAFARMRMAGPAFGPNTGQAAFRMAPPSGIVLRPEVQAQQRFDLAKPLEMWAELNTPSSPLKLIPLTSALQDPEGTIRVDLEVQGRDFERLADGSVRSKRHDGRGRERGRYRFLIYRDPTDSTKAYQGWIREDELSTVNFPPATGQFALAPRALVASSPAAIQAGLPAGTPITRPDIVAPPVQVETRPADPSAILQSEAIWREFVEAFQLRRPQALLRTLYNQYVAAATREGASAVRPMPPLPPRPTPPPPEYSFGYAACFNNANPTRRGAPCFVEPLHVAPIGMHHKDLPPETREIPPGSQVEILGSRRWPSGFFYRVRHSGPSKHISGGDPLRIEQYINPFYTTMSFPLRDTFEGWIKDDQLTILPRTAGAATGQAFLRTVVAAPRVDIRALPPPGFDPVRLPPAPAAPPSSNVRFVRFGGRGGAEVAMWMSLNNPSRRGSTPFGRVPRGALVIFDGRTDVQVFGPVPDETRPPRGAYSFVRYGSGTGWILSDELVRTPSEGGLVPVTGQLATPFRPLPRAASATPIVDVRDQVDPFPPPPPPSPIVPAPAPPTPIRLIGVKAAQSDGAGSVPMFAEINNPYIRAVAYVGDGQLVRLLGQEKFGRPYKLAPRAFRNPWDPNRGIPDEDYPPQMFTFAEYGSARGWIPSRLLKEAEPVGTGQLTRMQLSGDVLSLSVPRPARTQSTGGWGYGG